MRVLTARKYCGCGGESALEGPLASKKGLLRKIARERPGSLLTTGLEGLREDLGKVADKVDESQAMQPIVTA